MVDAWGRNGRSTNTNRSRRPLSILSWPSRKALTCHCQRLPVSAYETMQTDCQQLPPQPITPRPGGPLEHDQPSASQRREVPFCRHGGALEVGTCWPNSTTCTKVTDGVAAHPKELKTLNYLNLTDTKVTPYVVERLQRALPDRKIEVGSQKQAVAFETVNRSVGRGIAGLAAARIPVFLAFFEVFMTGGTYSQTPEKCRRGRYLTEIPGITGG